ncbi:transcription/translation regulatory transformer protein RfaH [Aliidiomarina haloalkalitolerans]|uniref:Transcription/translation regulatory transformer protein RfaH n=1 Tax=Aliidiomarina haloalkalitolerans TaxID=859059 RepID=A0A432VQX2_9GAMM|nr:transcription/translation regulatory transformer protein RfaH [Aliidiomarina haloalkalitolerans]RUO18662.1 transcription/translation regulatory transformer protein RfaH [Aliidiomarina haloalkalitolerans]
MQQWFVLQCKARQEDRAKLNVENQGYVTCLPQMAITKRLRGKRQTVIEAVFPGYLFVQLDTNSANFNALRSTRGVLAFVRFGGIPATIPDAVMQQLLALAELTKNKTAEAGATAGSFAAGTVVEVTDGPFIGLKAVYEMPKGEDRCLVLLDMLGKQQHIEIDEQILRVSDS